MAQGLKVTAPVLALISAGVVALGLVVAGITWLSAHVGTDAAPPSTAAGSISSQATLATDDTAPCGVDAASSAPVCDADGATAAPACDAPAAASSSSAAAPAANTGVPAIDRQIPLSIRTATFALG